MAYRRAMGDVTNPDFTQWDKTDWTIAGLVGFALWMGWSAMKVATRRLR